MRGTWDVIESLNIPTMEVLYTVFCISLYSYSTFIMIKKIFCIRYF